MESLRDICSKRVNWDCLPEVIADDLFARAFEKHEIKFKICLSQLLRAATIFLDDVGRSWMLFRFGNCSDCKPSLKSWLIIRPGDCNRCREDKRLLRVAIIFPY